MVVFTIVKHRQTNLQRNLQLGPTGGRRPLEIPIWVTGISAKKVVLPGLMDMVFECFCPKMGHAPMIPNGKNNSKRQDFGVPLSLNTFRTIIQ